jgi:hypothetical protein
MRVLPDVRQAELQVDIVADAIAEDGGRHLLAHAGARRPVADAVDHQLQLGVAEPLRAGVLGEQRVGGAGRRDAAGRQQGDGHESGNPCSLAAHGRHSTAEAPKRSYLFVTAPRPTLIW